MPTRPNNALTAVKVRTEKRPGRYADGNGLYLLVDRTGNKRWVQRLTIRGRRTDLGLGSWRLVSLSEAREKAFVNRKLARTGGDPRAEKSRETIPTFKEAVERVIALRHPDWRHPKTAKRWEATLRTYAYPHFGNRPLDQIGGADVLSALSPIWTEKPETSRAVRGHIRDVMDWAIAQEYRTDNPVGDAVRLGLRRVKRAKRHYRALHYSDVSNALRAVRSSKAATAAKLALEFMVLTAARPGEARNARWEDIDKNAHTWTIPAERMKAERAHRVPLSDRAIEILMEIQDRDYNGGLIFQSPRTGRALSDMTLLNVSNQQKWDTLGAERSGAGWRSGELPEGPVVESSPFGGLSLHLLPAL